MLTVDANVWVAAFDPHDAFHDPSTAFLRAVARPRLALHAPALLTLEVACALARRADDAGVGLEASERLRAHPTLQLHSLDDRLLETAQEIGGRHRLRAADALYAATAADAGAPLVTWDEELVRRAGAVTPATWLATHG